MRIALVGIGKLANYQRQASKHTKGIKLVDTNWTLGRNCKTTRLGDEGGVVELDHAKEYGRLHRHGHNELVFDLGTDKPRLVNHYCGVFANLAAMYTRNEDHKELSAVFPRLLLAALR